MAFFDLTSWFGRSRPPESRGAPTEGSSDTRREALICTRDSELSRELIEVLAERGYECTSHRNPWSASHAAQRTPPSLVMIDWRVGQHEAFKLASNSHKDDNGHVASILAVVPTGQPESLAEILELGVTDFIFLPVDRALLTIRLGLIEERLREIDHLKSLEKNVQREYQRFLIATGGLGDGIWDLDLETEDIHFSDRWNEMLGYQPDEIEGTLEGWLSRVHPEDLTRLRAVIDASIAGEVSVIDQRYRILTGSGEYRWMLTRGETVKNKDGKAVRVVGRQTAVDEQN